MITEGTLWMGDIEPWMDEAFIIEAFKECGFEPKSIKLIIDKRLNKYKNFCFVNFNNIEEANNALFNLNAKKIPKTNMFFKLNLTKSNSESCKNAYVGNLSPKINDIELFNFFKSKYPSVYYASIITDKGVSRGYGFVHFAKEEEYQQCLNEMDGALFHNKVIRVKEKKSPDECTKNNFNLYNKLNFLPYLNNKFINSFYTDMNLEEENSSNFNDDSTFSGQEKDQDLFSSNSSNSQKKSFSENIEIIENDDHTTLNSKMIESVNKLYEHERSNKKISEISNLILYYSSNYNKYNNDNYMC
jgi:RNA recognition motif-containing protein